MVAAGTGGWGRAAAAAAAAAAQAAGAPTGSRVITGKGVERVVVLAPVQLAQFTGQLA
jgi:hypothetical protein